MDTSTWKRGLIDEDEELDIKWPLSSLPQLGGDSSSLVSPLTVENAFSKFFQSSPTVEVNEGAGANFFDGALDRLKRFEAILPADVNPVPSPPPPPVPSKDTTTNTAVSQDPNAPPPQVPSKEVVVGDASRQINDNSPLSDGKLAALQTRSEPSTPSRIGQMKSEADSESFSDLLYQTRALPRRTVSISATRMRLKLDIVPPSPALKRASTLHAPASPLVVTPESRPMSAHSPINDVVGELPRNLAENTRIGPERGRTGIFSRTTSPACEEHIAKKKGAPTASSALSSTPLTSPSPLPSSSSLTRKRAISRSRSRKQVSTKSRPTTPGSSDVTAATTTPNGSKLYETLTLHTAVTSSVTTLGEFPTQSPELFFFCTKVLYGSMLWTKGSSVPLCFQSQLCVGSEVVFILAPVHTSSLTPHIITTLAVFLFSSSFDDSRRSLRFFHETARCRTARTLELTMSHLADENNTPDRDEPLIPESAHPRVPTSSTLPAFSEHSQDILPPESAQPDLSSVTPQAHPIHLAATATRTGHSHTSSTISLRSRSQSVPVTYPSMTPSPLKPALPTFHSSPNAPITTPDEHTTTTTEAYPPLTPVTPPPSFARPPKLPIHGSYPDPAGFPSPPSYPPVPGLVASGSSSTSARSSAYTSSGASAPLSSTDLSALGAGLGSFENREESHEMPYVEDKEWELGTAIIGDTAMPSSYSTSASYSRPLVREASEGSIGRLPFAINSNTAVAAVANPSPTWMNEHYVSSIHNGNGNARSDGSFFLFVIRFFPPHEASSESLTLILCIHSKLFSREQPSLIIKILWAPVLNLAFVGAQVTSHFFSFLELPNRRVPGIFTDIIIRLLHAGSPTPFVRSDQYYKRSLPSTWRNVEDCDTDPEHDQPESHPPPPALNYISQRSRADTAPSSRSASMSGLTSASEDETDADEYPYTREIDEGDEEARTAAIVVAEEGRGLIVHGEGQDVSAVNIPTGELFLSLSQPQFLIFKYRRRYNAFATHVVSNTEFDSLATVSGFTQYCSYPFGAGYLK